ncbi:cAMP-dependent protein kinase regulator [Aureococcus anophagefferens]|nr:cAMP-dependent protein kinase regulator [Aureococcus anophagefferens]
MRDGAEATAKAFCGNVDRMSRTSTIEWLGKTSFLQSLSHPQLELVSSIARFKSCVPEQTVIEQGAPTRAFYIVLHGNLRVTGRGGARVTERLPRATASVVATEETLLLVFDAIEFVTAISEYPEAATQVQDAVKLRMAGQLQTLALPIFASFDTHQLSLFTQTMKVTTFAAGTHIFEFGDSGEDFYILLQGEITIIGEDGKPLVTLHEKGDYFGEVALIRSEPRSASVVTATSATVAVVKGATFRDLFLTSPRREFEIKAMREKASAAAVLTHPSTAPLFKVFLDGDLASENYQCWDAIADYRAVCHAAASGRPEIHAAAQAVYDAYVDQASETCVNISHKLVRQLKKRVVEAGPADAPLDADAFEGVEAEINKMLKGNMMRFCNQDEYKIVLHDLGAYPKGTAKPKPKKKPRRAPPRRRRRRAEETKAADVEAKDAEAAETPPAASVPALAVPAADGEAAKTPRTPPATPDGHQAVLGGDAAATSPKAPAKLRPSRASATSRRRASSSTPARATRPGAGEN